MCHLGPSKVVVFYIFFYCFILHMVFLVWDICLNFGTKIISQPHRILATKIQTTISDEKYCMYYEIKKIVSINFHGHDHIVPYQHVITKSYFGWSKHNKNMTKEIYRYFCPNLKNDVRFDLQVQTFFFKCNF